MPATLHDLKKEEAKPVRQQGETVYSIHCRHCRHKIEGMDSSSAAMARANVHKDVYRHDVEVIFTIYDCTMTVVRADEVRR